MIRLTADLIVAQAKQFIGKQEIVYPSGKSVCIVTRVSGKEGPIYVKRQSIKHDKSWNDIEEVPVSSSMIWRYVNALNSGVSNKY